MEGTVRLYSTVPYLSIRNTVLDSIASIFCVRQVCEREALATRVSRANRSSYEETFAQRVVAKARLNKSHRTKSFWKFDPDVLRLSR